MLVSIRRPLAALTGAVALFAAAGCGAEAQPEVPEAIGSTPVLSPTPATVSPPPPSRTGLPSRTATAPSASKPAGTTSAGPKRVRTKPPATKRTATEAAASGGLRISNVGLTVPGEGDGFGRPVDAIHQEGCGSPDSANLWWNITVPGARFRETWYEYEVDAPAPLRGRSDDYAMVVRGDRTSVKTVIGPLPRRAANTGGGTIAITVVAVDNTSGERVTARASARLLPCD